MGFSVCERLDGIYCMIDEMAHDDGEDENERIHENAITSETVITDHRER